MSYLESVPRRLVTLYLPLFIIVFVLLFPFYWMGLTAIKPDEQLLDLDKFNPFWTWNPTFKHIHKLLFESYYPWWLWNTMYVAVAATILSIIASVLAAYAIVRLRYRGAQWVGGRSSCRIWSRPRSCSFRSLPSCFSTACSIHRWR
jgi:multiple sugar transport system permease protein